LKFTRVLTQKEFYTIQRRSKLAQLKLTKHQPTTRLLNNTRADSTCYARVNMCNSVFG